MCHANACKGESPKMQEQECRGWWNFSKSQRAAALLDFSALHNFLDQTSKEPKGARARALWEE